MNDKDKELLKTALSRTYGEKVIGQLGEYEFLRDLECTGKVNQGGMIQSICEYILWSKACPRLNVTQYGYLADHPLQQFIKKNKDLLTYVPEVLTHYIYSQSWKIDKYGIQEEYVNYIPTIIESEVNIE